jgi:hypothetical protein
MDSIFKEIQRNDLLKVVLVLGIIYLFVSWTPVKEGAENTERTEGTEGTADLVDTADTGTGFPVSNIGAMTPEMSVGASPVPEPMPGAELVPSYPEVKKFDEENAVSKLLKEKNMVISGFHAGVNTISGGNKIRYLDIRSVPVIPKQSVGPFLNSSYDAPMGNGRRGFELM